MPLTRFDDVDKPLYQCNGQKTPCISSWTWDDWHCNGCPWKGFGVQDVATGDAELKAEYEALKVKLGCT